MWTKHVHIGFMLENENGSDIPIGLSLQIDQVPSV